MSRPSLAGRMVRWQLAAMIVAWAVLTGWLLHTMLRLGDGDLDRRMTYFSQVLAETASAAQGSDSLPARLQSVEKTFIDGVIKEGTLSQDYAPNYRVFSPSGRVLYASVQATALQPGVGDGVSEVAFNGFKYRAVQTKSSDGSVTVIVAEREDRRLLATAPMLVIIGLGQLMIFGLLIAITWVSATRGLHPLRALAHELSRRLPGDLQPLSTPGRYEETFPIVRELNELFEREARRMESERGFLADAAHELRTPLAAIATQAHALSSAPDTSSRAAALEDLEDGVARVSHLLSQLLTLARLDTTQHQVQKSSVDLAELCRRRMAQLSRSAKARAIELTFEGPERLDALVSSRALESIVDNLVDNAIRYTPSAGNVLVRLRELDGGEVVLEVLDDGPGIEPHDRERVFERFVRLDTSEQSGTGLGLAIVKSLVQVHSASLSFIEGIGGRGVGLRLSIPASNATVSNRV